MAWRCSSIHSSDAAEQSVKEYLQLHEKYTPVIKEFEEDIPDLGREELICNKCGRPDYPKCKETVCEAWKYHKSKK